MEKLFDTKAEAIESIIQSLEKPKSFREIRKKFEEMTSFSVTNELIRQVAYRLEKEGKIQIEKKSLEKSEIKEGRGGRRKNTKINLIYPTENS